MVKSSYKLFKKLNNVQWRVVLEVVLTIYTAYRHCLLRRH